MSSITVSTQNNLRERLDAVRPASSPTGARSTADAPSAASGTGTNVTSVHVDLSPVARMLSARQQDKAGHADIDESNLPTAVKDLLKRIRELKEKLRELQQQMRQIQADAGLSPEQRQAQTRQLQAQIQALTAALSTATSALGKAMKQQNLSPEQLTAVASLLAA